MEQARIEHAPNGSLLTYNTIADAMDRVKFPFHVGFIFTKLRTFSRK